MGGAGLGAIPPPERLSVAGEERLELRNDIVADAGPFACGVNQTWKVMDWFGERETPGERLP